MCCFVSRFRLLSFLADAFLFVGLSYVPCAGAPAGQQDGNSTSLVKLQAVASSGDAAAQFRLAFYLFQTGDPPDYSSILTWLRSSTEQHYAPAQCTLGYLYEKGLGLHRDYAKAAENYRAAALQGDSIAQNNLGYLYYTGHGVHKDSRASFKWYRAAAEHGDPTGESNLGYLYYHGQGTRRDYAEAAKWFRAAAEQGDYRSERVLGYLYYEGLGVPVDYSEAAHWLSLAAQQGDSHAQGDLGFLYESGKGVPLDYVTAYVWYSRAMAGGLKTAVERRKSITRLLTPKQLDQARTLLTRDEARPRTLQQQSAPIASSFVQIH